MTSTLTRDSSQRGHGAWARPKKRMPKHPSTLATSIPTGGKSHCEMSSIRDKMKTCRMTMHGWGKISAGTPTT